MSDIGSKEIQSPRLQLGDRVEIGEANEEEHDTGTVVAFTFNGVRVHWDKADEIYSENPQDLRRIERTSNDHLLPLSHVRSP